MPGGPAGATASNAKTVKISTAKVGGVGTVLTTASGLTLYRFTEDMPGTSKCSGACAKIWPPLLAGKGAHVSGPHGVKGFSLVKIANGHWQVAFHKLPLYTFEGDKKKGQANGQNVGKVWFAVLKSGIPASATAGAAPVTPTTAPGLGTSATQPPTPTTPTTQVSGSSSTPAPAVTPTTRASAPAPTTTPPTQPKPPPTTTTTAPAPISGGTGF